VCAVFHSETEVSRPSPAPRHARQTFTVLCAHRKGTLSTRQPNPQENPSGLLSRLTLHYHRAYSSGLDWL